MLNTNIEIKNLKIKNRFCRSATWEGLSNKDGTASDELIALLSNLAENDCALVVAGFATINEEGRIANKQTSLFDEKMVSSLKELTNKIKKFNSVAAIQIGHGGAVIPNKFLGKNEKPIGPSEINDLDLSLDCRGFNNSELKNLVDDFVKAASIAKNAGFDIVQLHAAHGYLLSQFLSPIYNRRTDAYGGKILNRAKIIFEILEAIRGTLGNELVLSIKINCQDFVDGGLTVEESRLIVNELTLNGLLDMVEISGGLPIAKKLGPIRSHPETVGDEAVFKEEAKFFKEKIKAPIHLVASIRSFETVNNILNNNIADGISLSRPLIREPQLLKRWLNGEDYKAKCISCNACFKAAIIEDKGIYCPLENKKI